LARQNKVKEYTLIHFMTRRKKGIIGKVCIQILASGNIKKSHELLRKKYWCKVTYLEQRIYWKKTGVS